MKRTSMILSALLLALVPAAFGLWGNASFSQEVPVSVPASGQVARAVTVPAPRSTDDVADDHGGDVPRDQRTEAGDDRDSRHSSSPATSGTPRPSSSPDDHGGDRPRDQRTEAGDDRDSATRSDDSGHGSDDSGSDDSGSDDSGHGSDDSGSDDSGHGSDDSGSDDSRHGSDHGEDD